MYVCMYVCIVYTHITYIPMPMFITIAIGLHSRRRRHANLSEDTASLSRT